MAAKTTKAAPEQETSSAEATAHGRTMKMEQGSINYYAPKGVTVRVVAPVGCSVEIISAKNCDISVSGAENCDVALSVSNNCSTRLIGVHDSDLEMVDCTDINNV